MKRTHAALVVVAALCLNAGLAAADIRLEPDNGHFGLGAGMAFTNVPFSMSKLKLPLTYLYYDRQFTDPTSPVRASVELGMYGFEGIVPVPELGSNLYLGSEESLIQGKIGIGGFYDIAVGGHAGVTVKGGVILANRFDFSLFVVPLGRDSKRSYLEVIGAESKAEAQDGYAKEGHFVQMPYFGFLITMRH